MTIGIILNILSTENTLSIYPNRSNGIIHIESEKYFTEVQKHDVPVRKVSDYQVLRKLYPTNITSFVIISIKKILEKYMS